MSHDAAPMTTDTDLTLHTSLFGELVVPGGAVRAEELRALAAPAAVYATRGDAIGRSLESP